MTKDEALRMALEALKHVWNTTPDDDPIVDKAINAIKEALAQPEQEPVAWRYNGNLHEFDPKDWATGPVTPLYTTPPQRKPLTDEEILNEYCATPNIHQFISAFKAGVRYVEAVHGIKENT